MSEDGGQNKWEDIGQRLQTSIKTWISSKALLYSKMTIFSNTVLYTWNLLDGILKVLTHKKEKQKKTMWGDRCVMIVIIISQCVCISQEKAMAPHSSTPAWKIPWTEEPGGLQSMGSLRVGHDWATSLSFFTFHFSLSCIGEGNGNPLQCSCLYLKSFSNHYVH